jgi:hypothetical protein
VPCPNRTLVSKPHPRNFTPGNPFIIPGGRKGTPPPGYDERHQIKRLVDRRQLLNSRERFLKRRGLVDADRVPPVIDWECSNNSILDSGSRLGLGQPERRNTRGRTDDVGRRAEDARLPTSTPIYGICVTVMLNSPTAPSGPKWYLPAIDGIPVSTLE